MIKYNPYQMIKRDEMELEAYKYIRYTIDWQHSIGLLSNIQHSKMIKQYDKWLSKYNLKWQAKDDKK